MVKSDQKLQADLQNAQSNASHFRPQPHLPSESFSQIENANHSPRANASIMLNDPSPKSQLYHAPVCNVYRVFVDYSWSCRKLTPPHSIAKSLRSRDPIECRFVADDAYTGKHH
jgi:hypothetical protein